MGRVSCGMLQDEADQTSDIRIDMDVGAKKVVLFVTEKSTQLSFRSEFGFRAKISGGEQPRVYPTTSGDRKRPHLNGLLPRDFEALQPLE